jgi:class 3 adenylate cyclase
MPMPTTEWSGRRVAQYVVHEPLGAGGMGVVFKAHDQRLGRLVALKFLPSHLSADPGAKSRFVAEARAVAALDHLNVCTIYEIGEAEDGHLFIAMPLYDGETLQARLARGRLTFDEALPISLQVARGLGHAHTSGIVHRDVKPSNIVASWRDREGARFQDRQLRCHLTLMGTRLRRSGHAGLVRSISMDIWCRVSFRNAADRPFDGEDGQNVAILTRDPRLTATSYPDVPAGIDGVLRRALTKAPDDRHASMSLLAAELSALAPLPDARIGSHAFGELDAPARMATTERRRAAVLVTVVSDYPSLVDRMTPIEAHRLVARLRDTAVDVVRSYGGLVNQAIGEEIVSLFGVPIAHDDDDVRAVRAALELHRCVRALDGAHGFSGARLSLQSGLHVGPVVARRSARGTATLRHRRRSRVSVAARLAALAEPEAVGQPGDATSRRALCAHGGVLPVVLDSQVGAVTPFRVLGETGIATRLRRRAERV